jgi:hypothetical protein
MLDCVRVCLKDVYRCWRQDTKLVTASCFHMTAIRCMSLYNLLQFDLSVFKEKYELDPV